MVAKLDVGRMDIFALADIDTYGHARVRCVEDFCRTLAEP